MSEPVTGFAFGFSIEDESSANNNTEQQLLEEAANHNNNNNDHNECSAQAYEHAPEPSSSSSSSSRRPFSCLKPSFVEQLLQERALEEIVVDELNIGSTLLRRVDTNQSTFVEANNKQQQEQHYHPSDLQPGTYEGGGVVWEGSLDLIEYFARNESIVWESIFPNNLNNNHNNKTLSLLELGCGHALPSLYLMQQQWKSLRLVVFLMDYNESVLKDVTISNLVVNHVATKTTATAEMNNTLDTAAAAANATSSGFVDWSELAQRVVLGAGDWMDLSRQLIERSKIMKEQDDNKEEEEDVVETPRETNSFSFLSSLPACLPQDGLFDIILAAETLYTRKAAQDTAHFLSRHLRLDGGVAYVATKRYYFGVGGGADVFREFAKECSLFVETVHVVNTGKGNVREILRVTRQAFRNWF